ncbi:hypothetical protein BGX33_011927, partial [Mortierella sp. NVP41]
EELKDVHRAFAFLITHWTEEKNPAASPDRYGYTVQQTWLRSRKTWQYRDQLEEAVERLEREIAILLHSTWSANNNDSVHRS